MIVPPPPPTRRVVARPALGRQLPPPEATDECFLARAGVSRGVAYSERHGLVVAGEVPCVLNQPGGLYGGGKALESTRTCSSHLNSKVE